MKKVATVIICFLFSSQVFAQDTLQAKFSVVDVCDGVEAVFTNTSKVPVKFGGANYFWFFGTGQRQQINSQNTLLQKRNQVKKSDLK